jgi:hypothetical protein
VYALFQDEGIMWLFNIKTEFPDVDLSEDLAIILGPLTALALAIERIIETVFDLIEQSIATMAKMVGEGADSVSWVEKEYSKASDEVKNSVETLSNLKAKAKSDSPPSENELKGAEDLLKKAEERLKKASERLTAIPTDPVYVQMKRAVSIMLGLFLGFLVAIFSDQGIFAYLQQGVPRIVDIFVTGFIIGAGSGPMHSLIGILQGVKDSLKNFGKTNIEPLKEEFEEFKDTVDLDPILKEIEKIKEKINEE